jgi:hypothetical protein
LIAEGEADVDLDATAISSGEWVIEQEGSDPGQPMGTWFGANAAGPYLSGFALFGWGASPGSWVRSAWIKRAFDGTDGGGTPWTPGQIVGFRFRTNWTLDTGGGNIFIELRGAGDPVRVSALTSSFDLWTIPEDPNNNQVDTVAYAIADASGEIEVRMGGENYFPSCNVFCGFEDLEAVACEEVVVSIDSERYTTASLADSAARQQQLGKPYYLKVSTDGGVTFDEMLYAGYTQQITMERSLTFLLTGGDSGRGRRVSRAWTELNPMDDFVP